MKCILYLFFVIGVFLTSINSLPAQIVKSKDGVVLGEKADFIEGCLDGAKKIIDGEIAIADLVLNVEDYCFCMTEVFSNINSWEFEEAIRTDNLMGLLTKRENITLMLDCAESLEVNEENLNMNFKFSELNETEKRIFLVGCVRDIKEIAAEDEVMARLMEEDDVAMRICNCTLENLAQGDFSTFDLLEEDILYDPIFIEAISPCFYDVFSEFIDFDLENSENDIIGSLTKSEVPLIEEGLTGEYLVKLNLGGKIKYFILDTGATDMVISRELERELLINGTLNESNYVDKAEYLLADNSIVKANVILLDNIQIGDYTVNNVTIAVIDEGSLLLGKSFLDKFKDWSINKYSKLLILYKE
ncbi:MAG TPA: retropepsin-like aspartic protease [Flavobacteriaceae bacterium]|nr:retropepsin-like aspartic protease [Flavobacteriaceae bacterium]